MPTLTATSSGGGPHLQGTGAPSKVANPASAGGGPHLQSGSWRYRITLTVPAGQVSGPVYGLPLLVEWFLVPGKVTSQAFAFTSTTNQPIGYTIRSYNATTGLLVAYVNVDLFPASATSVYLYYG